MRLANICAHKQATSETPFSVPLRDYFKLKKNFGGGKVEDSILRIDVVGGERMGFKGV